MNRKEMQHNPAAANEIDRILASEPELVPSSGFLASVMESVREEAGSSKSPVLAPIRFPWKRVIPGIVLLAIILGFGAVEFVRHGLPALKPTDLAMPELPPSLARPAELAGWVALALVISLASWILARRLAGSSQLL